MTPAPAAAPTTVVQLLHDVASRYGERDLVVFDDVRTSYAEAERLSARLARHLLAAGVGKGGRVGVLFPNSREFVVTWFAAARIGAVAVPISTFSTATELHRILRHADIELLVTADRYLTHDYGERLAAALAGLGGRPPYRLPAAPYLRAVWVWGEHVPAWADAVDLAAEPAVTAELLAEVEREVHGSDPVSVIYTSGSTADPKGVVHTHGSFARQAAEVRDDGWLEPDERLYSPMPFFWVGGLTFTLLPVMLMGGAVLACSAREPRAQLEFLARERVTFFSGWPHSARAMAEDPSLPEHDLSAMRGGYFFEALPPAARPADPTLLTQALGMTETAGPHTVGHARLVSEELRGSFGTPAPSMEHRVVDVTTGAVIDEGAVGELHVRGLHLMAGLHKRERHEVFDPDGWYATGDLVEMRAGHVFFKGRRDDMIKVRGSNVSPREVELVLNAVPGVASSFVTAVTGAGGEVEVGAVVVLAPGAEVDEATVREHARRELSVYKVPRTIRLLHGHEVPMTSNTKVDRRALVALLAQQGG